MLLNSFLVQGISFFPYSMPILVKLRNYLKLKAMQTSLHRTPPRFVPRIVSQAWYATEEHGGDGIYVRTNEAITLRFR
jgi:hypothetical protein